MKKLILMYLAIEMVREVAKYYKVNSFEDLMKKVLSYYKVDSIEDLMKMVLPKLENLLPNNESAQGSSHTKSKSKDFANA